MLGEIVMKCRDIRYVIMIFLLVRIFTPLTDAKSQGVMYVYPYQQSYKLFDIKKNPVGPGYIAAGMIEQTRWGAFWNVPLIAFIPEDLSRMELYVLQPPPNTLLGIPYSYDVRFFHISPDGRMTLAGLANAVDMTFNKLPKYVFAIQTDVNLTSSVIHYLEYDYHVCPLGIYENSFYIIYTTRNFYPYYLIKWERTGKISVFLFVKGFFFPCYRNHPSYANFVFKNGSIYASYSDENYYDRVEFSIYKYTLKDKSPMVEYLFEVFPPSQIHSHVLLDVLPGDKGFLISAPFQYGGFLGGILKPFTINELYAFYTEFISNELVPEIDLIGRFLDHKSAMLIGYTSSDMNLPYLKPIYMTIESQSPVESLYLIRDVDFLSMVQDANVQTFILFIPTSLNGCDNHAEKRGYKHHV